MKTTKKIWMSAAMALGLGFATTFGASAQVADMNVGSGDIVWNAYTGEKIALKVSGPNGTFEHTFDAGVNPAIGLFDKAGNLFQDGTYTWQLVSIPEVSDEMKAARAAGEKIAAFEAVKQSGSFTVHKGAFVLPAEEAGAAGKPAAVTNLGEKAQVIATDLIVQGSECVGIDCTSSESFGFDTLRLKENNLRINFTDTSSSANFPGVDWTLLANESDNGGLNKFTIQDVTNNKNIFTVEANAPNDALYVDSAGNVGLDTNNPAVEFHVQDGDSPTIRLEQDGSAGFQSQTWDIAGNETNFFVRDVNNGSKLPFKIIPNAPTDSLYVAASGNVGIGTANPDAALSVERGDGSAKIYVEERTATAGTYTLLELNATQTRPRISLTNGSAVSTWNFDVLNDGNFAFIKGGAGLTFTFEADGDLSIPGNFISNGTTLNVPDYVFADDYYLPTLEEVQAHIDTNSHLPGVPSAQEVVTEGLDITEMQLTLLRKIEELTLYTLEQHSKIEGMQAEINSLKAAAQQ